MNIAIVEDDLLQRTALRNWLEEAGHHCHSYDSGIAFTQQTPDDDYQLLIFDWELPGMDGIELLEWLRTRQHDTTPVIFVTAHDEEKDIVLALNKGADDYLVKPARRQELLARIEAMARRLPSSIQASDTSYGPLRFNKQRREMFLHGEPVELTQKEFDLGCYLLGNIGKLISREELLEKIWGHSSTVQTRTIDTHISRLRKKLCLNREYGWHLAAVYQYGYRLDRLDEDGGAERENS